jgi:hypothetical protein
MTSSLDVNYNCRQILRAVDANIREIIRLISTSSANKGRCLLKLDNCLLQLDTIKDLVPANDISAIQQSLKDLHYEVSNEDEGSATPDFTSFSAPRLQSGKY